MTALQFQEEPADPADYLPPAGRAVPETRPDDLLGIPEVAELAGVQPATIRSYHSEAMQYRKAHHRTPPWMMPAKTRDVRRTYERADGKTVVVVTPVWRRDRIERWLARRKTPRKTPRK